MTICMPVAFLSSATIPSHLVENPDDGPPAILVLAAPAQRGFPHDHGAWDDEFLPAPFVSACCCARRFWTGISKGLLMADASFGRRLEAVLHHDGPLCVGVDPSPAALAEWGLDDSAQGAEEFGSALLNAAPGSVGIVKPQAAFYERYGSAGIAVLERFCARAKESGLLVVLDAKRGDISTTGQAYADAYLGPKAHMDVDAVTVSPYLGMDSVQPFFDVAAENGRGVFVLARTSNPNAALFQCAATGDGGSVAQDVMAAVGRANAARGTESRIGDFGVVFGATVNTDGYDLQGIGGPILAPGVGAQGATPTEVGKRFGSCRDRVVIPVSRAVASAGPDVTALRERIAGISRECREVLSRHAD
ncbi:orotidine-5'-phosphate decarboxylase [Spirillospora sp. CA-253888]